MKNHISQNQILIAALFTAAAVTVYLLEFMLPRPLPFLKLGLANIFVLILLVQHSYFLALIVTVSKTVIGGFFSGLLISPHTLFSLGGSICAFCVMSFCLFSKIPFSLIGISILGAVFHNLAQLYLVYLLLIQEQTIMLFLPLLLLLGVFSGTVSGFFAIQLQKKLQFLFTKT